MSPLCIDSQRQSTVECNEQVQTLRLTDLADDDAGGAHAQRLLNQATQGNLTGALEAWLTALHRGHVAQRDLQFVDLDNWWSGLLQRLEFPHAQGSGHGVIFRVGSGVVFDLVSQDEVGAGVAGVGGSQVLTEFSDGGGGPLRW